MKTKKIGLLAIGLLFLAGAVFVETEDVMAYKCIYGGTCDMSLGGCGWNDSPGDSCDSSSSPNCTVQDDDPSNGTLSVCLVDNLGGGKCCFGQANCDVSCTPGGAPVGSKTDAYRFCKEQKCTDSQDNALYVRDAGNHGVKCWVSEQEEGEFPANIGGKFVQGYWDYYTSRDFSGNFNIGPGKCVTCNGAKEDYILGDSLMNYINQNGGDSSGTQGNGVFEYACGADESCDEKVMGNVCSPPAGGRCNANGICEAAVAATHMACSADGWCVSVTGAGADECDPDDADGHDECGCTCSDGTICENCSTVNLGTYCNSSRELETDCNDHDCCPAGTTCNLDGFCITLGCDNIKIDFDNEDGSDTKYEVGDDITVYGSCDIVGENFGMSLSTGDSDGFVGCTTDFLEIESTITGTGTITATVDVMPSGLICTASIYADDPPTPPAPPPPPACNNDDHKDATEVCDGTDLDGKDCTDFGCTGGILACVDCAFDTSGCTGCGAPPPPPPPPPPPGPTACDPNSWFFCNPLRTNVETLAEGGERIIGYILGLIGSVFLLLIVISGAMYMTSAGNEERIASSKKILTAAVIGLAIALLAYSLLAVIMKVLGM